MPSNLVIRDRLHNQADLDRLLEGLGAKRSGAGWSARCPSHADSNPSLAIGFCDGRILVHCHAGCPQEAVLAELRRRGLWPRLDRADRRPYRPAAPRPVTQPQYPGNTGYRDYGLQLWDQATPLLDAPWPLILERYFQSRRVKPFSPCLRLRFHPRMPYGGGGLVFPALLALATNIEDKFAAVQATFLKWDGSDKAAVHRKTYGSATGCAVRLLEGDDMLIVGEGVETTLSSMQALGEGGYATLGTSGLRSIWLPEVYRDRRVMIAADNDASGTGQSAAREAARRLIDHGFLDVSIAAPDRPGQDFNDVLRDAP